MLHPAVRLAICLWLFLRCCTGFLPSKLPLLPLPKAAAARDSPLCAAVPNLSDDSSTSSFITRKYALSMLGSSLLPVVALLLPSPADADAVAGGAASIAACARPTAGGKAAPCVSTASVRQIDLFVTPWTWSAGVSVDEVVGRLKGAIASDAALTLEQAVDDRYFRVTATRALGRTDRLEFVVNPVDRVVTFRSEQIAGPEGVGDFGAVRRRLDLLRRRAAVLDAMGADVDSADSGPREGTVGQLRAFWGLQTGEGYESVLLDDDGGA